LKTHHVHLRAIIISAIYFSLSTQFCFAYCHFMFAMLTTVNSYKCLMLILLKTKKSVFEVFKGGRASQFWLSNFSLKYRCTFSFHPKHPNKSLKWPWKCFLLISKIQNLLFFIFEEFPEIIFALLNQFGFFLVWNKK
jgi:hypothetical protein